MKLRYFLCQFLFFSMLLFFSCSAKDETNPVSAVSDLSPISHDVVIEEPIPVLEPLALPYSFRVKTGPAEVKLFSSGEELVPIKTESGIRDYILDQETEPIIFQSNNFISQSILPREISAKLRRGILQIKLEPEAGIFHLAQEIETGKQPKSALFSPDGKRVFVPLLNETGVDVFSFSADKNPPLCFEKRINIPEGKAVGFVESYIDERRNEFLVSNMDENKIHVFNLTNLEYKTSIDTGGIMPKVINQNPSGTITVVSNWLSHDITLIDSETKEKTDLIPVGATPRGMSFSPDGSILYVALFDGPNIAVIDMHQKKHIKTFTYSEGIGAARHVLFRDNKLYVSDMYQGRVYILQADDGKVLHSLRVGPNVNTICFSADKKILFVSSRGRNNPDDYTIEGPEFGTITALNAEDLSVAGKVWGRNQPTGLAVSPDGNYFAFTDFLDANMELYRINYIPSIFP